MTEKLCAMWQKDRRSNMWERRFLILAILALAGTNVLKAVG